MTAYYDLSGNVQQANITPDVHKEARDAKLTVEQLINRKHADADPKLGTAFQQVCASVGLALPGNNAYGIQPASIGDILDGRAGFSAALNTADHGTPFGTASRTLFPPAIIAMIEAQMDKDRVTDSVMFDDMVAQSMAIGTENFEQPVVDYSTAGGPQSAKAQRVAQGAEPATILKFSTADRIRRLPTFSYGMEFSDQALRATTLPVVSMMAARFFEVNKDERVYDYMSSLFLGDTDMNTGAIPITTASTLDSGATGGTLTHKAWVLWLAMNRKYRRISHVACTIGTYLAVEKRTGRPGLNATDLRLLTIDPQAVVGNNTFGDDVKFFIVDDYATSGLIPEGELWGVDSRFAITKVSNTTADYAATEQFVLSRSSKMRIDYSEAVFRTFGNTELQAFTRLNFA